MNEPRLVSVDEQKEIIPDAAIREAFLEREDIANLAPDEQEARWQIHLVKINHFIDFLSGCPGFVVEVKKDEPTT